MKRSKRPQHVGVTRRTFVKSAAAISAATALSGFPAILRGADGTIKVGMPTVLSGRVASLGVTSRAGTMSVFNRVNEAGGINGRKLELITRDTKGKPDEAARATRELVNTSGCQIIMECETTGAGFAIQEVIRDMGILGIHAAPETSSLTADPKIRSETAFRSSRCGIHDSIAIGIYTANISKELGLTRFMAISPDYAYGRQAVVEVSMYAKRYNPKIEFVDESWPKLFQPDYTEVITKVVQVKPQAIFTALWGGDLSSFIDQASLYGMFKGVQTFATNLGDYSVLDAIKEFPEGLHTGNRYNKTVPPTKANMDWYAAYKKEFDHEPTNWSWESATGATFIVEALKRTNGDTDGRKLAAALKGMTIQSPFGVDGTVTMRAEDHTVVGYGLGMGRAIKEEPRVKDFKMADWAMIFELEREWKKQQGYI